MGHIHDLQVSSFMFNQPCGAVSLKSKIMWGHYFTNSKLTGLRQCGRGSGCQTASNQWVCVCCGTHHSPKPYLHLLSYDPSVMLNHLQQYDICKPYSPQTFKGLGFFFFFFHPLPFLLSSFHELNVNRSWVRKIPFEWPVGEFPIQANDATALDNENASLFYSWNIHGHLVLAHLYDASVCNHQ